MVKIVAASLLHAQIPMGPTIAIVLRAMKEMEQLAQVWSDNIE